MDDAVENEQIELLREFKARRDGDRAARALDDLQRVLSSGGEVMPASIACVEAGVTTGEWADALRRVYGEYRAPTGVGSIVGGDAGGAELRAVVQRVPDTLRELSFVGV